ncbi:MAG: TolC family protein [Endomicrobium sp.]|jgi:outer membrane protein TolC|nr:TolC family protein [Endomicrobium sp.]
MKKIVILLIMFLFTQYLFAKEFERELTEASSIQTALSVNPDILEHSQDVEYTLQLLKESKALYFPNIDFNLNLAKFNTAEPMIVSGESSQFLAYLPKDIEELYYSTRLSIWQYIYSGGRIKTTNKLAKIKMKKVENEQNMIKNKVINKVKLVFNNCLCHKELLNYYNLRMSKIEQGKIHISNLELKILKRKIAMEQFNYEKEILNLLNTIGIDLNTIVDISGTLKPRIKKIDLNKCLLLAYQFSSEIKATQEDATIDGLMLNLLSMQKYPNVSIGVAQEWLGDKIVSDKNSWYVSINASIPIFDGGSSLARVKQGRIKMRENSINRVKLENEIKLKINQYFLEYNFWLEQVLLAKLIEKNYQYNENEIEIIRNLNRSYFNLEFAVGVNLDSY